MVKTPKRILFSTFILFFSTTNLVKAQWVTSGTNIYYDKGNAGIGTTNPQSLLSLGTKLNSRKLALHDNPASWFGFGIQASQMRLQVGNTNSKFSFFSNDITEIMTLKGNGMLGIGTTNPQTLLSLGTVANEKKLALYDNLSNWFGFGIQTNQMRLQIGDSDDRFSFFAGNTKEIMTIKGNGKIGIGTTNPQAELAVNGKILAKEVQVKITGWADYVFENDYALQPIAEVEKFIKENKHLPGIPNANKVEQEGIEIGKMNTLLLEKIEELTLYIIQQNKSIESLQNEMNHVKQLQKAKL